MVAAMNATAATSVTVALPVRRDAARVEACPSDWAPVARIDGVTGPRDDIVYCDAVKLQIWPLCA